MLGFLCDVVPITKSNASNLPCRHIWARGGARARARATTKCQVGVPTGRICTATARKLWQKLH